VKVAELGDRGGLLDFVSRILDCVRNVVSLSNYSSYKWICATPYLLINLKLFIITIYLLSQGDLSGYMNHEVHEELPLRLQPPH